MSFYTFQLARIDAQSVRSNGPDDTDLITFAVLVNGRDQGHGTALTPVFPGVLQANDITQGALINGMPTSRNHMTDQWVIGPLWVQDTDQVSIVYSATNTNDSQLPTADQQQIDAWTVKFFDIVLSWLVGEFVSGLGLNPITEYIGANVGGAAGAVAAFFADPVGTVLGLKPHGPCNGIVFAGKKEFTGAQLRQLPSTAVPAPDNPLNRGARLVGPSAWSELTDHYTDEATHNNQVCAGSPAQTDVTIRITRYDYWSLEYWAVSTKGSPRTNFPTGGSFKELYGLRI